MHIQTPQELINGCQGLVRSIAWKIHQKVPRSVDLDDLIGYGQIGLAEAARDFDASRGNQFTTYAYYRVRGAILDGLSTMSWFSRTDFHRGRYEQAANDVLNASAAEEDSGNDSEWFARTSRALCGAYVMTYLSDEGNESAAGEIAQTSAPSEGIDCEETRTMVETLIAGLPEPEQKLIHRVYFDGWSIKQAGEEIGVSKAWASRLHAKILERLAVRLTGFD
jgi:RNA polymerase sigma factor FliA